MSDGTGRKHTVRDKSTPDSKIAVRGTQCTFELETGKVNVYTWLYTAMKPVMRQNRRRSEWYM